MSFPPRCKAIITIKGHKLQCSKHAGHDANPELNPCEAAHMFHGNIVWSNDPILDNGKTRLCGFNHESPYVYGQENKPDRKTYPGDKDEMDEVKPRGQ